MLSVSIESKFIYLYDGCSEMRWRLLSQIFTSWVLETSGWLSFIIAPTEEIFSNPRLPHIAQFQNPVHLSGSLKKAVSSLVILSMYSVLCGGDDLWPNHWNHRLIRYARGWRVRTDKIVIELTTHVDLLHVTGVAALWQVRWFRPPCAALASRVFARTQVNEIMILARVVVDNCWRHIRGTNCSKGTYWRRNLSACEKVVTMGARLGDTTQGNALLLMVEYPAFYITMEVMSCAKSYSRILTELKIGGI